MDPNETFAFFMKALREKNTDDMFEHGGNLSSWLKRGGFAPTVNHEDFQAMLFEILVARTAE
jgi:hypothetical protein